MLLNNHINIKYIINNDILANICFTVLSDS